MIKEKLVDFCGIKIFVNIDDSVGSIIAKGENNIKNKSTIVCTNLFCE